MAIFRFFPLIIGLFLCMQAHSEVIFEDDFMGDNVDSIDALNWQWWIDAENVFVEEADDAPQFGPGVLALGPGSTHIGLEAEDVKTKLMSGEITDYRVSVLWTDRLIDGEADDADFHFGIRCQEYDAQAEAPGSCYEIEVDGDDNNSANEVPEDGPTSFHVFIRGGANAVDNDGNALAHVTRDVVPQPVANVWYWTVMEVEGFTIRAKHWRDGETEPDWMLEGEDLDEQFPQGGVRIGVWSGLANVSYVKVETIETSDVLGWDLF